MAVAFYNANTSYTTDVGTDVALERLRNLEIVDRFTGESIASSDLPYGSAAASGYRILPGGTTNSTLAPGVYAVIGESIEIPSDTNYIFPVGVHVLHFNCQLIFRQTASRSGTAANGFSPIRSNVNDSRVSEGSATTGGVHYYGCSFTVYSTVPANDGFKVNDFMNSTYNGGAQTNRNRAPFAQGARVINGSFLGAGSINFGTTLEFHEVPEIIEGIVLDNCSYEMQNLQGIFQVTHPDFTNTGSDQRFRFQPLSGGNVGGIQTIGHFTTADNTTATNITYSGGGSTQYAFFNRASANNIGGVWSYYSWEPSFFEDLERTIPIEGVRVRVASNAGLASTTVNSTTANFFTRLSTESTTDIDLTAAARNSINEYITDGTGFVVAGANTSYSVDGTTFTTGEWIDWLRHGVIANSLGLYGGASTAQAFNGTNPPNNAVIALVFQLANGAMNQYETSIRARSYSHDVIIDEEIQSSRIGTGIGEQDASVGIATQERPVLGPSLVGTVVKDANVTSTNTPSLSFPADNAVSINDIRDARRAEWYEYAFGTETTDPLTQDISFTLNNGLGSDYTSTASAITVRADGIEFGTGDLFNTDANLIAGDFGNGSLQGHSLTFSGAVTNLGSTTTSEVTAASCAFSTGAITVDGSTITTTGNITFPGSTATFLNNPIFNAGNEITSVPTSITGASLNGTIVLDATARTFTDVSIGVQEVTDIGNGDLPTGTVFSNCITDSQFTVNDVLDFTVTGGTNEFTLTVAPGTAQTWTFNSLTENSQLNINLPTAAPAGAITLQTDSAATRAVVEAWITAQGFTTVGSGVAGYHIPVPVENFSVMPDTTLGVATQFALRRTSGTAATVVRGSIAADGTITYTTGGASDLSIASDSAATYIFSLKPDSTLTGQFYRTTFVSFAGTDLTANRVISPDALATVPTVFTTGATALKEGASSNDVTLSFASSTGVSVIGTWANNTGAVNRPNANETIAAIGLGTNDVDYYNWLVVNEYTVDPIAYSTDGATLVNNQVEGITGLTTSQGVFFNSTAATVQSQISQSAGFNTSALSGVTGDQVLSFDIGNAPLGTVNQAISGQFAALAPLTEDQLDTRVDLITQNHTAIAEGVSNATLALGAVPTTVSVTENP